jgi:hypothetical protein
MKPLNASFCSIFEELPSLSSILESVFQKSLINKSWTEMDNFAKLLLLKVSGKPSSWSLL